VRRIERLLKPLVSAFLFGVALWILKDILHEYRYAEIVAGLRTIPTRRILVSLALTALGYTALAGYDAVALRYIGHPLPFRVVLPISFTSYAVANSAPVSVLTGGGLRYRLYSGLGLTAAEMAQVATFDVVTYVVGLFSVGGVIFLVEPLGVPRIFHLPIRTAHPIGLLFLALVTAYLLLSIVRKRPIRIRGWEIPIPSTRLALGQMGISAMDWTLSGAALYVLLPAAVGLSYPAFLAAFLLAQIVTLITPIPGGLGIFEALILLMIPASSPKAAVVGSLVVYRVIYYLLPLLIAATLLGVRAAREEKLKHAAEAVRRWAPALVPDALALATFVAGAVLLLSGALPAAAPRLDRLIRYLPLGVIELAHVLGSVVGLFLLILAWGLGRRLRIAYRLTVGLLLAGILFSLLKGLAYAQAVVLAIILVALIPARGVFYREGPLARGSFGAGWSVAVILAILATVWLGLFAYKGAERPWEWLGRIAPAGNLGRFFRATIGAVVALVAFGVIRLLRRAPRPPALPTAAMLDDARAIVEHSPRADARLALLGDKALLFSENGRAFVMYAGRDRSRIAFGDPVGPEVEWGELVWQFRELADRTGARPAFYGIHPDHADLYLDLGLTLLGLGETARVRLDTRVGEEVVDPGDEGLGFEVVDAAAVAGLMPELQRIAAAWREERGAMVCGFAHGEVVPGFTDRCPAAVVRRAGRVIAFASVWPGAEREELAADPIRFLPEAPGGILHFLLGRLMRWGTAEGYRWFDLGLAPARGAEERTVDPVRDAIGILAFRYGEHFESAASLRKFKERFRPVWEPRLLASPGGFALPGTLADIAALMTGATRGVRRSS